jgi:glycosyltransferase involved in cell wall biosynthesis
MKILHILNTLSHHGNGIVNVAVDLACIQAQTGHTVAIASNGGEYESLLVQHGVQHFQLNQRRTPHNLIQAARRYRRIIRQFQPDIVHAHMMTGMILSRCCKGFSQYKMVSTVHNEFQRSSILMGLADNVIAVSQAVANSMVQRGIPANKLYVVRNGILSSPRKPNINYVLPAHLNHPAITTVAGMYDRKGISELISAFCRVAADFPTAHLYLVGNGPDRGKFEAQAAATDFTDRIHFEGFQAEPSSYLKATDIFVLASHKDPSPLVIPEAREAGCAIIATHVDGIPEALDHGNAGYLVPPHNPQALAEKLQDLLQNPHQLLEAKQASHSNLDWLNLTRMHQETMNVYQA